MRSKYDLNDLFEYFNITKGAYYAQRKKEPTEKQKKTQEAIKLLLAVFNEVGDIYGAVRIYYYIKDRIKPGFKISKYLIEKIKKELGINCIYKKKPKSYKNQEEVCSATENLVNGNFKVDGPNQLLLSDITYIPTIETFKYAACIKDAFTKEIIGYAIGDSMKAELVMEALKNANLFRPIAKEAILHSDQGAQYRAKRYQEMLQVLGIRQSMSRKGTPTDNAPMESFFSTMKNELFVGRPLKSKSDVKLMLENYLGQTYNYRRLHSSIGYLPPAIFYKRHMVSKTCQEQKVK